MHGWDGLLGGLGPHPGSRSDSPGLVEIFPRSSPRFMADVSWEARWVRWPDFRLPADRHDAHDALHEAWRRATDERVEIACGGGHGRTGTALACLAVLDGVLPREAVAYVREHYDSRAVETPWQHRYVTRFATS